MTTDYQCPGNASRYNKGCRCDGCKAASAARRKAYAATEEGKKNARARSAANRENRRRALAKIKLEAGCVDCGYDKNDVALQFDHVKGEKEFTISSNRNLAWHRVLAEISKCEVVCANCHLIRTSARAREKHGTVRIESTESWEPGSRRARLRVSDS